MKRTYDITEPDDFRLLGELTSTLVNVVGIEKVSYGYCDQVLQVTVESHDETFDFDRLDSAFAPQEVDTWRDSR